MAQPAAPETTPDPIPENPHEDTPHEDTPVAAPGRTAREVLAELTPDERIAFLHQHCPAVERLGLGAFHTGTEALHGLSWLGTATVFPQPPGLAASWDPALLRRVGDAVATEVRAKHAAQPEVSLNVWAPVVNPLRHPLWGRGEEGYSEDPDLTAEMATAYCRGLRGEHPQVWKTVPTLKHFLAYGNETDRAATSSHLPPQALRETELPAFIPPMRSGAVGAVMPSYNLVNGRPAHVSGELIRELRTWAPHSVAIVSDAQAPSNLVEGQRYFPDHVSATAAAIHAGLDSFTDSDEHSEIITGRISAALAQGLLTQDEIDAACLHILELRERTGELIGQDPYNIPPETIDTPAHRELARESGGDGVVILANDGGVLPLAEDARVIAVLGPFADHVVHDWYSGTPPYTVSLADALRERYPDAQVRVASGADVVALRSRSTDRLLAVSEDGEAVLATAAGPGAGEDPAVRFEVTEWGHGVVTLRSAATGRLLTGASWIVSATATRVGGWVAQETFVRVVRPDGVAFRHAGSGKWLRVQNGTNLLVADGTPETAEVFALETVSSGAAAVTAACAGADLAFVALGNDPHVHGRETEDRPDLALPGAMQEIWRLAVASRAPSVLTLVSSYPYAIGAEAASAAAVVWTCHAGQELGHALVDVLSGDRTPRGRLAQTWWADERDAGGLFEYDVIGAGQTYRYSSATPLYALGHGLGYAPVTYEAVVLDRSQVTAPEPTREHTPARWSGGDVPPGAAGCGTGDVPDGDACDPAVGRGPAVLATVTVHNAGAREADELVALWARADELPLRAPRVRLAAWARVRLAPGERRDVRLCVPLGVLAVWDVAALAPQEDSGAGAISTPGAYRVQPGRYTIAAGPSAAEPSVTATVEVQGPPAPVRALERLGASDFHSCQGLATSDRTRERGTCLETAPGCSAGDAVYLGLDLSRVASLAATVARARTAAWGPATLRVDVRPSGVGAPWAPLTAAVAIPETPGQVPASEAPFAWQELSLPCLASAELPEVADLRVRLTGAARIAELELRP